MTDAQTQEPRKPTSKTAWKKAKVHEGVRLPSGAVVSVQLPNLLQMLKGGNVPNELVDVAIQFADTQDVSDPEQRRKLLEDQWDFVKWIVPLTLVDPEITSDDVDDLPIEDLELIAALAGRTTDVDAVGNHLGGLHTSREWRQFRGRFSVDEVAASL